MSITDELREYALGWDEGNRVRRDLTAIADRIDAEHESACAEAYGNGVMSVPIALDESAWVELPKDADGEPIHAGDVLDGYGKTIEVVEMRYGRGGWVLISRDGSGYADTFAFAHRHAPTVEDVLRECCLKYHSLLIEGMSDVAHDMPAPSEIIAECAVKLRLAGEDE